MPACSRPIPEMRSGSCRCPGHERQACRVWHDARWARAGCPTRLALDTLFSRGGGRGRMAAMGLGRITRFAPTPADSRRVNVMHAGRAGVKALAPPDDLFADFSREKSEAKRAGASAEAAHAAAFRRTRYRARFREHILSSGDSREALRALVEE